MRGEFEAGQFGCDFGANRVFADFFEQKPREMSNADFAFDALAHARQPRVHFCAQRLVVSQFARGFRQDARAGRADRNEIRPGGFGIRERRRRNKPRLSQIHGL